MNWNRLVVRVSPSFRHAENVTGVFGPASVHPASDGPRLNQGRICETIECIGLAGYNKWHKCLVGFAALHCWTHNSVYLEEVTPCLYQVFSHEHVKCSDQSHSDQAQLSSESGGQKFQALRQQSFMRHQSRPSKLTQQAAHIPHNPPALPALP